MAGSYITNPIEFLINTLIGLYILCVMLRFLLAVVRADFYNPVSQFLVKVTNPLVLPLRRIIPSAGRIDTSALLLMLLLQMASFGLIALLRGGQVSLVSIAIYSVVSLLYSLTEPVLRPCRRLVPPISGIDLSPLVALIAIQLAKMLLIPPLQHLAQ